MRPFLFLCALFPALLLFVSCRSAERGHVDAGERGRIDRVERRALTDAETRLPIFNYHHLSPVPSNASSARVTFTVTPEMFEQQLNYLKEHGYQTVPLDALTDFFDHGTPIPPKAVALTFDDGWRDQHEYAFPLLKKYGFTATFFVPVGWVGHPKVMPWSELQEMADAGMAIGIHGYKHRHFDQIGPELLEKEIVSSKAEAEKNLTCPMRFLAYPGGHWTTAVVAVVKSAGYAAAMGVNHDVIQSEKTRYCVPRFHAGNDMKSITGPLTSNAY